MEQIEEKVVKVKNAVDLLQYLIIYFYYKELDNPITYKVYPHEFDTWEEFDKQKEKLKSDSISLAKKLFNEQDFKKRQLDLGF